MRYEVGKTYIITKDGTNSFHEVIKNNLVGQRFKVHKALVDIYVVHFLDLPELGLLAEQTFIRDLYTFEAEEVLEHEKIVTEEMIAAGEKAASGMMDAQIAESMHGLGGSKTLEELDENARKYVGRKISSVEGIFLAMYEVMQKDK
jgi:hypothetical protein